MSFLFTDIEGSTKMWEKFPDAMKEALARQQTLRALIDWSVSLTEDGLLLARETSDPEAIAFALLVRGEILAMHAGGWRDIHRTTRHSDLDWNLSWREAAIGVNDFGSLPVPPN